MPRLLELPNEVLHQIIQEIWPDDIENFASCCKILNELSQNALARHRGLRDKYNVINLDPNTVRHKVVNRDVRFTHPVSFLRAILENPRIAYYPEELIFGAVDETLPNATRELFPWEFLALDDVDKWASDDEWEGDSDEESGDEEIGGKRKIGRLDVHPMWGKTDPSKFPAIKNCPCLIDIPSDLIAKDSSLFEKSIVFGDRESVMAVLLFLLPNLRSMVSVRASLHTDHFRPAIETIVEAVFNPDDPITRPRILRNLRRLEVIDDMHDVNGASFIFFNMSPAMPTLRVIRGYGIEDPELADQIFPWRTEGVAPLQEMIHLTECAINGNNIALLVPRSQDLLKKCGEYPNVPDGILTREPTIIFQALLKCCPNSLELLYTCGILSDLSLFRYPAIGVEEEEEDSDLPSRAHFRLCSRVWVPGEDFPEQPNHPDPSNVVRLIDVIPQSLESLGLPPLPVMSALPPGVTALEKQDCVYPGATLPTPEDVCLETAYSMDAALKEQMISDGIKIYEPEEEE